MRKLFPVLLTVLLLASASALAQETAPSLKDVPANHWAASAVNDLVKKGITQGYPDGTFRGDQNITRYETAMFLSKLAAIVDTSSSVDVSGLKADIKALKDELEALKKSPSPEPKGIPITGSFKARYRVANSIAAGTASGAAPSRGPRIDYRLKTTLSKDFGDGAGVKVNLDTMDAGWGGGAQDLATRLLDVEGRLALHAWDIPINVKMTAGPGPQLYSATMDATFRSDVKTIFMRPRTSFSLQTFLGAIELNAGYTVRTISPSGEVDVSQLSASIGYTMVQFLLFDMLKFSVSGDELARDIMKDDRPNDTRGQLQITGSFNEKTSTTITLGASESVLPNQGYYVGWELSLADAWDTGTFVTVGYHRMGPEYIVNSLATAEFDIIGLDLFDHPLINNTQNWELSVAQFVTDSLALKAKAEVRLNNEGKYGEDYWESQSMLEGGISYNIAPSTVMDLLYQTYQVPSDLDDKTSDITTLSFMFKF